MSINVPKNCKETTSFPGNLVLRIWWEFDSEKIKEYIKHTLDVTKNCVIEMILKDTHTCENRPERFTQWTDIAQDLVSNY